MFKAPSLLFLFPFLLCLIECKQKLASNEKVDSKTISNVQQPAVGDSVKIVGEKILNGEKMWGNNEKYIFPLMDSVKKESQPNRPFYFKVFGKITEQADGYVAEAIGRTVLSTLKVAPNDFIRNSELIDTTTLSRMAIYAGDEISISASDYVEAKKDFERLRIEVTKNCKNLTDQDKTKLDHFFKSVERSLNPKIIK